MRVARGTGGAGRLFLHRVQGRQDLPHVGLPEAETCAIIYAFDRGSRNVMDVIFGVWIFLLGVVAVIWASRHLALNRAIREEKPLSEKEDRKSTRLNSSHSQQSRMPSSA